MTEKDIPGMGQQNSNEIRQPHKIQENLGDQIRRETPLHGSPRPDRPPVTGEQLKKRGSEYKNTTDEIFVNSLEYWQLQVDVLKEEMRRGYRTAEETLDMMVPMLARLENEAEIDELTGLYNRRTIFRRLYEEAAQAKHTGSPLSIVMVDLDHFGQINNTFGHKSGDDVLKDSTEHHKQMLRNGDILGRYGGEEFIWVLPNTPLDGAANIAETIRKSMPQALKEKLKGHDPEISRDITMSLGIAEINLTQYSDIKEALTKALLQADECVYASKGLGRNTATILEGKTKDNKNIYRVLSTGKQHIETKELDSNGKVVKSTFEEVK